MRYPPPAAGRFDYVETHGLRPCRRLRRRACGPLPALSPAPAPSQALPLRCPLPKAKTLPPHRPQAVSTASKHTGEARVGGSAAGPAACPPLTPPPAPPPPSNPFPPTQSLPIRPSFPPCPHPITPNSPQYCKLSVNTLRTYVLFRRHMLQ